MIQMAVSQLAGVEWIEDNVEARTITLRHQPHLTTLSDVRQALVDAGYPPAD